MLRARSIPWLVALILAFSFAARPARGQASLAGRITEVGNSKPVPGAHVAMRQGGGVRQLEATSDAQGVFRFPLIEPGDYRVTAEAHGYFPVEYSVTAAPRQPVLLTLELVPQRAGSQQVNVSARFERIDPGRTGTQQVLTRSDFEALPSPVRRDVLRLAENTMPGAVSSHDNFLHVRGNELSLHEFINGVSFLDNPHEQFTAGLSPQIFQSVNLITGGFPAEFGNRFGGVLDVTTRSGSDLAGHGSATLGAGTVLQRNAAAEYGGSTRRVGYYLYAGGFESGRFLNPPAPREIHDLGRGLRSTAQIDYRGEGDLWKLFVAAEGSNFQLPNTPEEAAQGRDASRRLRSQTAILSWQHVFSTQALLATSAYERNVSDRLAATSDPETPFGQGSRSTLTMGAKSDFSYARASHTFKSGLDLTLVRLRESFTFDPRDDSAHSDAAHAGVPLDEIEARGQHELGGFSFAGRDRGGLLGVYLQDRFSPLPNFTLNAGMRWDQVDLVGSYHAASPRLGLAYHVPRSKSVVHFSYNRFFSPPPLEYVVLASFLGNTSPEPEARTGNVRPYGQDYYEAGWSQELHPKVLLELAAYSHRGRNAYETSEISNTRLFLPTNFARSRVRGAEVSLSFRQLERIGLSGRMQYAASRVRFYGPISGGFTDEHVQSGELILPAFDQIHSGTASLFYRHRWREAWGGLMLRFGSGTPLEHHPEAEGEESRRFVRLPAHFAADLSAGVALWRRKSQRLAIEFNATNLTNSIYRVSKESETTPVQFAPRRVVAGSLTWEF